MDPLVCVRRIGFGDPSPPAPSPLQERGSQMQKCAGIASKCAVFPVENERILQPNTPIRNVKDRCPLHSNRNSTAERSTARAGEIPLKRCSQRSIAPQGISREDQVLDPATAQFWFPSVLSSRIVWCVTLGTATRDHHQESSKRNHARRKVTQPPLLPMGG